MIWRAHSHAWFCAGVSAAPLGVVLHKSDVIEPVVVKQPQDPLFCVRSKCYGARHVNHILRSGGGVCVELWSLREFDVLSKHGRSASDCDTWGTSFICQYHVGLTSALTSPYSKQNQASIPHGDSDTTPCVYTSCFTQPLPLFVFLGPQSVTHICGD